jgi:hypothetical protein
MHGLIAVISHHDDIHVETVGTISSLFKVIGKS